MFRRLLPRSRSWFVLDERNCRLLCFKSRDAATLKSPEWSLDLRYAAILPVDGSDREFVIMWAIISNIYRTFIRFFNSVFLFDSEATKLSWSFPPKLHSAVNGGLGKFRWRKICWTLIVSHFSYTAFYVQSKRNLFASTSGRSFTLSNDVTGRHANSSSEDDKSADENMVWTIDEHNYKKWIFPEITIEGNL